MRAWAIFSDEMVLSDSMSSGRTMPADDQLADLEVDPDLLLALDHQVAVGQHLGDHGGDVGDQLFRPRHAALAVVGRGGIGRQHRRGDRRRRGSASWLLPSIALDAGLVGIGAVALGLVLDLGLVVELDLHGEDVADLLGALVLEEGARAVPPQRIGAVGGRDRGRASASAPACSRAAPSGCRSPTAPAAGRHWPGGRRRRSR